MRIALLLFVLSSASIARADVVDPEPERCPRGSTPSTAHSGPYCAPRTCLTDVHCGENARCMELAQCVENRACGGLRPPDAELCVMTHVAGACDELGTACADEARCIVHRVCVGDDEDGRPGGGGCSCAVPGRARASAGLGLVITALASMFLARRRRAA
ncbi:hypothetical protein [Sandaracinus amylolyticus]|uniref:Uncharacterized protein n=1 Tax=Sandaracinus amylolyticus TaxID=927083 RepID=A0A0F6YPM1_9BACT|nr:hypothetical protein [Sandaracinus amylolyticus]AKF11613.1 hypothetical protein DB32_008762 [Sandaracinus amylolyticus]